MADNTVLNTGSGGDTIATDDIGGVKFQRVKLVEGADGVNDGDVSAANPLPVVQTGALPAGTNNIGDVDVLTLPAIPAGSNKIGAVDTDADATPASAVPATALYVAGTDGTNARGLKTDTAGELQVDVLTLPALAAGSNNIGDVDVLTMPSIPAGTNNIGDVDVLTLPYDVAHDNADSGNPLKVGTKAVNALAAVGANDRANAISDLFGRVLVSDIDPAMQVWKSVNVTSQQTGTDVWSPASGKKIAVTYLAVCSYSNTAGRVILWFGDNADTTYTAGTDQLLWAGSFAPSTTSRPGMSIAFSTPVFCTTADREIHLTTDAGISLDITVYGYEW